MSRNLVAVAVPAPLYTAFDYEVEQGLTIPAGARVRVPFGRRQMTGLVLGPGSAPDATRVYKPIGAVLDSEPLVPAEVLGLCQWAAAYYQHPIGEVIATALPGHFKQGKAAALRQPQVLQLTESGRSALRALPPRARAQRALLQELERQPLAPDRLAGVSAAVVQKALGKSWIERVTAAPQALTAAAESAPALTPEQTAALEVLRAPSGRGREAAVPEFSVTLLEGVTGSGKTELYLRRAAEVIAAGRQVLMLAPEIGLTPQLTERFTRRFGAAVACYHSAMAEGERSQTWLRARSGQAQVVVGTRSAAFLPFARLGLIVVDEEHDGSFKQQEGLRYSARDLVIVRAQRAGIPVILGSATPALETLHNARSGRYRHARLTRRIQSAAPPQIRLLDVGSQPPRHGITAPLLEAIGRHLGAGGQALLFINRRGYAPLLRCQACGWQAPCRHCDARMTLHRARGRLICHHCGEQAAIPAQCGACKSAKLVAIGQGTERVEDALREAFPAQRIERFDSDRMRRRGELERLLADIGSGAIHILVGTQMLAKGHDFARLSLVGILNVDQALYGSDFRALERMGQLVTQVAGRAGRAHAPGEVILQTREPQHLALRTLLSGGYPAFCDWLLAQRRASGLPPFSHLALLRADSPQPALAFKFLERARAALPADRKTSVLGPVPAPMEKLGGRHRAQVLLQSGSRAALQNTLGAWVPKLDALAGSYHLRWSVDVDPLDLF